MKPIKQHETRSTRKQRETTSNDLCNHLGASLWGGVLYSRCLSTLAWGQAWTCECGEVDDAERTDSTVDEK